MQINGWSHLYVPLIMYIIDTHISLCQGWCISKMYPSKYPCVHCLRTFRYRVSQNIVSLICVNLQHNCFQAKIMSGIQRFVQTPHVFSFCFLPLQVERSELRIVKRKCWMFSVEECQNTARMKSDIYKFVSQDSRVIAYHGQVWKLDRCRWRIYIVGSPIMHDVWKS